MLDKRIAQNRHFLKGYSSLTPAFAGLVKRKRLGHRPLKSTFNAENFLCRLSWFMSRLFGAIHSWNVRRFKIAKNLLKLLILGVQGHSRSLIFTFLKSSSPVLVMISSICLLLICNHFHGRRANSGKNNVFLGWMLIFSLFSFAETS